LVTLCPSNQHLAGKEFVRSAQLHNRGFKDFIFSQQTEPEVEIAFLVPIVFVGLSKGPMKSFRRSYYNFFSRFYDRFVALHSSDAHSVVRRYLSELVPVTEGERILDICTGTGSLGPLQDNDLPEVTSRTA
jgi:hypothetical protein